MYHHTRIKKLVEKYSHRQRYCRKCGSMLKNRFYVKVTFHDKHSNSYCTHKLCTNCAKGIGYK